MLENKYNSFKIPAGLLITFLEKALLLIHMETHLNDVSTLWHIVLPATLFKIDTEFIIR